MKTKLYIEEKIYSINFVKIKNVYHRDRYGYDTFFCY